MRKPVCLILMLAGSAWSASAQQPAASPAPQAPAPTLRARIYDVACALGNDGFKLRDGAWTATLEGGQTRRLAVNLFAGNQYWFCAATSAAGETPVLLLKDPAGRAIETVSDGTEGVAVAGVTAPATGLYTLECKGSSPGTRDFCLLYLFK